MRYEQSQSYPPLRNYISTVVKINVSHLNWFLVASSGVTHHSGWVSLLACLSRDHQTRTIYCKLKVASPSCSTLVTNSHSHSLKLLFHPATELISLCLSHPGPVSPPTLILVTVTHNCLRCLRPGNIVTDSSTSAMMLSVSRSLHLCIISVAAPDLRPQHQCLVSMCHIKVWEEREV